MKKLCKNCSNWYSETKANQCEFSARDYFLYKKMYAEDSWYGGDFNKAVGNEVNSAKIDMEAVKFIKTRLGDSLVTKKIIPSIFTPYHIYGIPSLLNKYNDCYFYTPKLSYILSTRYKKSVLADFFKANLLIDGFLSERIKGGKKSDKKCHF